MSEDVYCTEQYNLDGKKRKYSIYIDGVLSKEIVCDSIIKEYSTVYNVFVDYENEYENAYFFEDGKLVLGLQMCCEIDIKISYQNGKGDVYVTSKGV